MKTMINFSVVVMMAVFSVCVAQAESLTVFDNGHKCCFTDKDMTMTFKSGEGFQVIYPESALSSMKGKQINAMMYYMDGTHGNGIDCSKVRASLGISTEASFTSKDYITGLTQVGTASLSAGEKEIVCQFDKPFVYTGGTTTRPGLKVPVKVPTRSTWTVTWADSSLRPRLNLEKQSKSTAVPCHTGWLPLSVENGQGQQPVPV